MANRIEQLLVDCKDFKTPEECFQYLDSQELTDAELRRVIDTKYFLDSASLRKAYVKYGKRLIDPSYIATVQETIISGSNRPIHSSARVL